jgi:hypothetical protein
MSFDNTQALREGWRVVHWPITIKIEAFKPRQWAKATMEEHEQALAFVQRRAAEGSAYHIEALAYVAFSEPPQFAPSSYEGHMNWINLLPHTPYPKITTS